MRQTAAALFLLCSIAVSQAFAGPQQLAVAWTQQQHPSTAKTTAMQVSSGGASSSAAQPPVAVDLKAPPDLYQGAVAAGAAKAAAPPLKIFQLGVVAGAHIAIGAYLAISVGGACPGLVTAGNAGLQKLVLGAIGLPTGLIMTLVTGAELFTGNTALVTGAYMEGRASKRQLLKNWVCSYAGNFVGSLLLAALAHKAGTLGASPAAVNMATAKCAAAFDVAFCR